MINSYLAPFVVAALISCGLTYYVKKIAQKLKFVDLPSPRKVHSTPIPRLGGVAIVVTFLLLSLAYNFITSRLEFSSSQILHIDQKLFGVLLGVLILLVTGIIDDIKGVAPWKKLISHFLAATVAVGFGLSINYLRIPGGNHIELNSLIFPITFFGNTFQFVVWADLLTILWIVTLINTMNFLDGLDGLAGGVSLVAGLGIFFLSFFLGQPAGALLAMIFSGAVLGFLPWNFNPAKIFMGDSGSMFLGYMLAVLSVISGGKLATAFLILGLPLLDAIWVILRRILGHRSPFMADKLHLHHRLLDLGLSQRQVVIILYLIALIFAIVAIFADTQAKIEATVVLFFLMILLVIFLVVVEYKKKQKTNS